MTIQKEHRILNKYSFIVQLFSFMKAEQDLSIRAAWLAYVGGNTQEQIAERLGVSRIKAQRLLAAAVQGGHVKFFVEGEPAACMALENQLMATYGLKRCIVVPDLRDDVDEPLAEIPALAVAAARFLVRVLDAGEVRHIGIGHGRTLAAMVERLPASSRPDIHFVSLLGSLTRRSAANPYDVIARLAERTGGECYFLPVPFFADSRADAEVLRAQRGVQHVFQLMQSCQLCVVGIGEMGGGTQLLRNESLTKQEWTDLTDAGAVGEIAGCFVDANGKPVPGEINERSIAVSLQNLRGRDVLAVAGGKKKAAAIRAVLKTGVITTLIVDEATAQVLSAPTPAKKR